MAAERDWPQWPGFTAACAAELEGYGWPGNVRELRNVVERAVYRWNEPGRPISQITFDPFASPWKPRSMMPRAETASAAEATMPSAPASTAYEEISDLRAAVDGHEAAIIRAALDRFRYNQRATAKGLGLTYDQLRHCMKKHGLSAG
jgi:psp operon transcriptional activator